MLNLSQNLYSEDHSFKEAALEIQENTGDILGSDAISGIEIRLSHVIIKDNRTPKIFPFPGLAKVYFVNLVVSDVENQSIALDLKSFEKVDDGDSLSIDKTLFFWKKETDNKAPSQIHIMSSIIKSKQGLRDVAEVMSKLNDDADYKNLTSNIVSLLKTAGSVVNISNAILTASSILGKYLGNVEDKPLLTWFQSFTDIDGDYDKEGKTVKQAENKYAAMNLSITIRDKDRQIASE
ncbi:hypothetical protein OX283_009555 [Flavobacterium sp. SUN052]|uniref:hypothetical protein n=1 Tax=Flavobacterium sp. SUN052 TaxID=3002441 RepID=UPI00237ED0E7|nr:hypothetical protein [Flavobacterium sp. SUN052]MEC4004900.1 hypothetical protein [Flavobacterium sp. SUN052]